MQFELRQSVPDLVVDVAVCEHRVEVVYALLGIPVEVVLQTLFYCAHVHRGLDYLIVILKESTDQAECIRLVPSLINQKVERKKKDRGRHNLNFLPLILGLHILF